MGISEILAALDLEIAQLQQARVLLGGNTAPAPKKSAGRPSKVVSVPVKKKRNITPEGRKRIAEAVRRRWAAQKKAASAK